MATVCAPLALISPLYRAKAIRLWARVTLKLAHKIAKLDFELRGQFPSGPCLIAARHGSIFEILALIVLLDNPAFVMKRELLAIPFIGCYAGANMIAINRRQGVRALKLMVVKARSAIAARRPLVIFPEGTRVLPGCFPRLKSSGTFTLYERLGLTIIPVALNSGLYWQRGLAGLHPGKVLLEVMPSIPSGLTRSDVITRLAHSLREGSKRLEKQAYDTDNSWTDLKTKGLS